MKTIKYSHIIREYFSVMKKYPVSGIGLFICMAIGVLFSDTLRNYYFSQLFDFIAIAPRDPQSWGEIIKILLFIIMTYVGWNVFNRASDFMAVYHQSNVMRDLNNVAFEKLQKHSYGFFANNFAGALVAKVKRFVSAFERIHDEVVFQFWKNGIRLTGIFIVLLLLLPPLGIFFGVWCVLYCIANYLYIRYRKKYDLALAEYDSKVTAQLADTLTNILNLKMFTGSKRETKAFHAVTQKEYEARTKVWKLNNWYHAFQDVAMAILEVVGMLIAIQLWMEGAITPGTVVLAQLYFASVLFNMWTLGRAMGNVFKGLSDAAEMVEIFETPIEVKDPKMPQKCRITKGDIQFRDITFHYENNEKVFSRFNLHIPAGQKVGIVGPSGAGKSSLFRLILRFMDIQKGDITIDNQSIQKVTQDNLRRNISFVPQEPILFHRSLFENIAYGKPKASREQVLQAAKRAHAHEFIQKLPKKYDTLVGERGIKLSGGERQRIAVARAFLKDAPVLLLDEATSSLDSLSEKYIQENLRHLMQGRTTIAIAHRISTIQQMDRILVMDDGRIVEEGTHAQLLEKNGLYSQLWYRQSNGFLLEPEEE